MTNYLDTHGSKNKSQNLRKSWEMRSGKFHKLFSEYLPKEFDEKIVDVGCSTGQIVGWLQSLGYENSTGIDSDETSIMFGRNNGINNLYVGDLFEFLSNLESNSIKLFILRDITEHFCKKDFERILDLISDKLSLGGYLWIQTPNAMSPAANLMLFGDWTHEWLVSSNSLKQLVMKFESLDLFLIKGVHVRSLGLRNFHLMIFRKLMNSIYMFYISSLTSLNRKEVIIEANLIAVAKKILV